MNLVGDLMKIYKNNASPHQETTDINLISYTYGITGVCVMLCASIAWILIHTGLGEMYGVSLFIAGMVLSLVSLLAMDLFVDKTNILSVLGVLCTVVFGFGLQTGAIVSEYLHDVLTMPEVVGALGITLFLFAIAAVYGTYVDLDPTKLHQVAGLALMCLLAASLCMLIASMWFDVSAIHLFLSYIGIGVFMLLTVSSANMIKSLERNFKMALSQEERVTIAMFCALSMFLDIVNIFVRVLRIMAANKKNK